jgi:ABC-2 type transport system permease protein
MMLPILFVMPIIQLLILANAATFELTSIPVYIVDQDRSELSRRVTSSMLASEFFEVRQVGVSTELARSAMDRDEVKVIVVMGAGMERELVRQGVAGVQVLIDAVDGFSAGIAQGYISEQLGIVSREWGRAGSGEQRAASGVRSFAHEGQEGQISTQSTVHSPQSLVQEGQEGQKVQLSGGGAPTLRNEVTLSAREASTLRGEAALSGGIATMYWYNPTLEYIPFMVPGILVVLVSMIGGFLSGMNVVREREIGTMEQLNVTPITRGVFIAGKLLPFWVIALVELWFGLIVARFAFGLVSEGSLWLIFGSAAVFMVVILGLGLFISTISDTQQQAMFITWFIMVLFILMGGLFTPIDSMPEWAQQAAWFNPMTWYIDLMRRVMLTGAGLEHVWKSIVVLAGMGVVVLGMAVRKSK